MTPPGPEQREPLGAELEAFVEARRRQLGPSDDDKERLYARLASTLGLPHVPPEATTSGPSGPAGSTSAGAGGTVMKAGAVVVAAAVVAIGAYTALRGGGGHRAREVVEPTPDAQPDSTQAAYATGASEVSLSKARDVAAPKRSHPEALKAATKLPPKRRRRARKRAARRPSSLTSSLAAERQLLERARAALARRRNLEASRALKKHRRQFPRGKLAQEREALLVLCLVRLGQHEAARAAGARFRKKHPNSIMLPVVIDALKETRKRSDGSVQKR